MYELRIDANGAVTAMYADDLLQVFKPLGHIEVTRASHVEYDPTAQAWGVWNRVGQDTKQRFETREAALAWERDNFWSLI